MVISKGSLHAKTDHLTAPPKDSIIAPRAAQMQALTTLLGIVPKLLISDFLVPSKDTIIGILCQIMDRGTRARLSTPPIVLSF